jgi:hypothetical protein
MHRRPIIAALSLLVGLSSHQLEVAFGFSIAPGSPRRGTTAAAAAVVDHPVSWTRLSSSLSLPVVVPPQIPITATKSTTMKWTSRTASFATVRPRNTHRVTTMTLSGARGGDDYYAAAGIDPSEIIARRIVVTGDVDGGYYRSCVKNEVRGGRLRPMGGFYGLFFFPSYPRVCVRVLSPSFSLTHASRRFFSS